ncbi:MAG: histidine phosphatase family protein [Bryobacterales bacterium]
MAARDDEHKRFYIVRHGLTKKPGVLLGQFDAGLSAEGSLQARVIAGEFAHEGIERIISSRLARARETACWIARPLGLDVDTDDRLNEITYGRWDGMTWEQIEQIDPEIARQKLENWWSAIPPGAESGTAFVGRVEQAWNSLIDHPATATVVVAHEAVNAVLEELARRRPGNSNEAWQPDWQRISNFRQQPGAYHKLSVEV